MADRLTQAEQAIHNAPSVSFLNISVVWIDCRRMPISERSIAKLKEDPLASYSGNSKRRERSEIPKLRKQPEPCLIAWKRLCESSSYECRRPRFAHYGIRQAYRCYFLHAAFVYRIPKAFCLVVNDRWGPGMFHQNLAEVGRSRVWLRTRICCAMQR